MARVSPAKAYRYSPYLLLPGALGEQRRKSRRAGGDLFVWNSSGREGVRTSFGPAPCGRSPPGRTAPDLTDVNHYP
jgi:hypothetical protein